MKNTTARMLKARRLRLMRKLSRAVRVWCEVNVKWQDGDWHVTPKPWEAFEEIQRLTRALGRKSLPTSR